MHRAYEPPHEKTNDLHSEADQRLCSHYSDSTIHPT